ncbi:MAG: radical SAM protein [Bacteroidota bacterium]
MQNIPIVFIAFQEQDNLGVGYLCSTLVEAGYEVEIIDYRHDKKYILERLQFHNPLIIGFSIIFQYHLYDFKQLINFLRENGIKSHFSAGGHYPSLRYKELLKKIPQIDSVVRFEGEWAFLELVNLIYKGKQWKDILNIAYIRDGTIVSNPIRPLENDLDKFQPPARPPLKEYALNKKYATLLAGRGCYYNCSFCSIREFYSEPPGPLKRVRRPEMVAREIELLHEQLDCAIFMFQDDDFPLAKNKGKDWAISFCEQLHKKKLNDKILWKINCRPDEVDKETFMLMKNSGLFLVYLGIEAGTDLGLKRMNKHLTVEKTFQAINILKELEIAFDFGFMLFDPWSTYKSILGNLTFLEKIIADGSSPITYCKMLPYAETQVELQLKNENRLKRIADYEDYDFLDGSLDNLYTFLVDCFDNWIGQHDGVLNLARWARYYFLVEQKYYPMNSNSINLDRSILNIISESNKFFIDVVKKMAKYYCLEVNSDSDIDHKRVAKVKEIVNAKHFEYQSKLNEIIKIIKNSDDKFSFVEEKSSNTFSTV